MFARSLSAPWRELITTTEVPENEEEAVAESRREAPDEETAVGASVRSPRRRRRRLSVLALIAGTAVMVAASSGLTSEVFAGRAHVGAPHTTGDSISHYVTH